MRMQSEAAESTTRHEGPTAQRYESALHRYVSAVAADEPESTPQPVVFSVAFAAWTVSDVMTRTVLSAHEDAPIKEIVDALHRNRISSLPVTDRDRRVLGMVTVSDVLARMTGAGEAAARGHHVPGRGVERRKRHALTARELMTTPAITVGPNATIEAVARLAARSRVRSVPVVDNDNKLLGIVTRADLIKVFLRDDEQIRRDIERDVIGEPWETGAGHAYAAVSEGIVTLSGKVPTARAARRLVHAAHLVTGVVDVKDELEYEVGDSFMAMGR
jgi:CBS-domain-containing membrane protein